MSTEPICVSFKAEFDALSGDDPKFDLVLQDEEVPFAHEVCGYLPKSDVLFVASKPLFNDSRGSVQNFVRITRCRRDKDNQWSWQTMPTVSSPVLASSGVRYDDGVLFCQQGNTNGTPSALVYMSGSAPITTNVLLDSFNGRDFNSIKAVTTHSDGSLWFTDPAYGYEQGFRPPPRLPCQVYYFHPQTGDVRAMADGFDMPNALCFNSDETTLYVSDTGRARGDGSSNDLKPSTIYALDVEIRNSARFLMNRRLFAFCEVGVPNSIACDSKGNIYAGCGDGVNVWSAGGALLGKFAIPNGVSSFCFGRRGELFLTNGNQLIVLTIHESVEGALNAMPQPGGAAG